ncbi:DNA repair protein RadC [Rhizobium leguminosarum bv. trifolii]|uniref:DNA repair protein RadC n=2 Tax=Rhizobium leguminosarum TaxID=384 RepID=A0A3E1BPQ2_RHILT|nr:DNA repair protein RadC [Rhizobium leguminosarum bv. trifolii]RFB95897.1 DNA repair protein RadC [Rhizobium leguminosarum bv. trifolii]
MTMVIIDAANALDIIVHDHIINGDVGLKGLTLIKHRSG